MLPIPKIPTTNQPTSVTPPVHEQHRSPSNQDTAPAATPINWLWVGRDVFILFVATYLGAHMVGFTAKALNDPSVMSMLSTAMTSSMTFGFFIVAYLVRENRVRHFMWVALLLWFFGTLPNAVFFNASLGLVIINWLATAPLITFAVLVGGAAGSALFKPKKKKHAT